MPDELVNVRYMVDDVEDAVAFYTDALRLHVRSSAAPAFADVVRGNLRLLLSGPASSAGRPMPDGRTPGRAAGTASTSSSTTSPPRSTGSAQRVSRSATTSSPGPGGRQILLEDPSGNPIELFQPAGR